MTSGGILVRLLACLTLVFATWNPTGYCFIDWVTGPAPLALKAVAGAVLVLSHILFARITWLSLGPAGLLFVVALLIAGLLTLWEFRIIDLWQRETRGYALLLLFSLVLLTGVTWSLMKRRVTGQSNYLNPPP